MNGDGDVGTLLEPQLTILRPEPAKRPAERKLRRLTFAAAGAAILLSVIAGLVLFTVGFDVSIRATGSLQPAKINAVRALQTGIITHVAVMAGDTVAAGDILAAQDTFEMALGLRELRLQRDHLYRQLRLIAPEVAWNAARSQALLEKAEADVLRFRAQLREQMVQYGIKDVLPPDGEHTAIDQAVAAVRAAEAELSLAVLDHNQFFQAAKDSNTVLSQIADIEWQIHAAEEAIRRTRLTAPISGVVLTERLTGRLHERLESGDVLLEIGSLDAWVVEVWLSARQVRQIQAGQVATIEMPVSGDKEPTIVNARVDHVSPEAAHEGPHAGLYRVLLGLNEQRPFVDDLRRGYSVQVRLPREAGRWPRLADVFR
jgi:HlyD family secretion protein